MDLLPPDLQFLILSLLNPSDIISLRMTCKSFHSSSQQRTVWLAALHRVCIDHGAFMPSFSFKDMSIEELEHAALSPSRLADRMRNGTDREAIEPRARRTLQPLGFEQQRYKCNGIWLIPGGRFMLTRSKSLGHGCISLWDLGNVGAREKIASPVPVAVIADGRLDLLDACPTADWTGILVSTCYVDDNADATHVVIYEIYPSAPDAQFMCKGKLTLNELIDVNSSPGGRFAYLDKLDNITFWDIATNDSFTWKPPIPSMQTMFLVDRYLILLNLFDITMWEIPFFRGLAKDPVNGPDYDPKGPSDDDYADPSQPELKQALAYNTLSAPTIFSVPSPWWPTSRDLTIGVALAENKPGDKMAFYRVEQGSGLSWGRPMNRVGTASPLALSTLNSLYDLQLCDNDICQRWQSNNEVVISLMATPTQKDGSEIDCMAITRSLFRGPTQDFDFCSVSGRFVVSTEEDGVSIMDFVVPTHLTSA